MVLIVPPASPVQAGTAGNWVVSSNPADFTPDINDGAVYALLQLGDTVFAGGSFTSVTPATGGPAVTRRGLLAFSATTGEIRRFAPAFNGSVWALATDGRSLYVGGKFTTVAGVTRRYLAKLDPVSGAVQTGFNAKLKGEVTAAKVVGRRLVIGGEFSGALRAVRLTTGADTGYLRLGFRSSLGTAAGRVGVYRFAVNRAGTRLVAIGNFTSVGGSRHVRAVMVNLGARATVNKWYYAGLSKLCRATHVPNYLRGVDFSPDGSYFVLVSTGGVPARAADLGVSICDAAARFSTTNSRPKRPTWINYTGGDTILAVNVTEAAVYIQGHFRWLNNEGGRDSQGPAGVPRSGIGALRVSTGRALSWNPGKDRGIGGKVLLTTSAGLWVGSDTTQLAGETRARVAFLPLH